MSPQGVEIVPESLTPLRRGGRTATWAIRRWETDCRTLALSGRKLALLTIIRGDKANESSERGWWHDTIKSLWHQGSLPSELSEGQTVIGIFAEVLSCSYLIKLSLCSCFRCFFFFHPTPHPPAKGTGAISYVQVWFSSQVPPRIRYDFGGRAGGRVRCWPYF